MGTWPDAALLPNNVAGNLFMQVRFNNPIDKDTVLSDLLASPEVWRCRGLQGRAYALEHFSQRLRDQQWEQILTFEVRQARGL